MDKREIANTVFGVIGAGGVTAVIAAVTTDANLPFHNLLLIAGWGSTFVGAVGFLWLFLTKTKQDPEMAGDTYNVSNSGSGFAVGQIGTLNVGKQPFRLTEEHKAQILALVDRAEPVSVGWFGHDESFAIAAEVRRFLETNGVRTIDGLSAAVPSSPLPAPIVIQGNSIMVQA